MTPGDRVHYAPRHMSQGYHCTRSDLTGFTPAHPTLVGVDSDGCVFDTMEIKQKRCFHGLIASHWHLGSVEPAVREVAEFINLYSRWRGQNRFPALVLTFDLLREHPAIRAAGAPVPRLDALRRWTESGALLGNPVLEKEVARTNDPELATVLAWSKAVNAEVERVVRKLPPFEWARRSLEKMVKTSDVICVSQTPGEALVREWEENGLTGFVRVIAGQELGTKTDHLELASRGRYAPGRVLMVGDALGDLHAARHAAALFFPINPGHENASWERFFEEAYARFLDGTYGGRYEAERLAEFETLLPEVPPWKPA